MSDSGSSDRRIFGTEFRERLARVETTLNFVENEIVGLRRDRHDMAQGLQTVMAMQEEARDHRLNMSQKLDSLHSKVEPMIATSAQIIATVSSHITQCVEDKREIHQKLNDVERSYDTNHAEHNRQHIENIERFSKMERRLAWYAGIAVGVGTIISSIIGHGGFAEKLIETIK